MQSTRDSGLRRNQLHQSLQLNLPLEVKRRNQHQNPLQKRKQTNLNPLQRLPQRRILLRCCQEDSALPVRSLSSLHCSTSTDPSAKIMWVPRSFQSFRLFKQTGCFLPCFFLPLPHFILWLEVDCIAAMVDCFRIRGVSWDACGIVGLFWVVTTSTVESRACS